MKAVNLIVNHHLPDDLRDYGAAYDSKGLSAIMGLVAQTHPEKYEVISKSLSDIGREASWTQGETIHLGDMLPVLDRDKIFAQMDNEIANARRDNEDPDKFREKRLKIWARYSDMLEGMTMKTALAKGNNLAYSVVSGARGKPPQLKSMLTTPGLYTDYKDDPIPLFVRNSFGDGLRPAEYLAGAFGARKSVIATKAATARGGDFCLAEDTEVRMADGSCKPIGVIKPGDMVMGSDLEGVIAPTKVLRVFDQGVRQVEELVLPLTSGSQHNYSIRVTKEHKFAVIQGDAITGKKRAIVAVQEWNSRTRVIQPSGFDDATMRYEPFALLAGLMLGDGHIGALKPKARTCFTCFDPSLIADVENSTAELGLMFRQRRTQPNQYRISRTGDGPNPLKQWLISEGLGGLRSHNKKLPYNIHSWDNTSVWMLVAGYLAADGCITRKSVNGVYYPYISFTSVSKQLLQQLQQLLWIRFGIRGSEIFYTPAEKKVGFKANYDSGIWSISKQRDVEIICTSVLPFIPGVKRLLVDLLINNLTISKTAHSDQAVRPKYSTHYGEAHCFDIEVAHKDNLFLLGCGVVCSNSKQLTQVATATMVTAKDCKTNKGIALDLEDDSIRGRTLAISVGDIPVGTTVDKHVMAQLRKSGIKEIVARSAMTCDQYPGVCAKCVGEFFDGGKLPKIGDAIGITAANSVGEPITQGALNVKHTAGVSSGKKEYSGFDVINQIAQSPEIFPDRAAVSEVDGRVGTITDAPQGGKYVTVGGERHYVPPGYPILVKVGDRVEAGDQLADGIMDPGDQVRLRGLGEGRKFYAERLKKALDDSGMKADRRNTEILARSAIDHVIIDDPEGMSGYLPDDMVSYNALTKYYTPPEDVKNVRTKDGVGKFLQRPVLHYSIGTRLTPRMIDQLDRVGVSTLDVNDTAPQFSAEMSRLRTASHVNEDWLASQHTSHLKHQLNDAAVRGSDTNIEENIHFVPRLAYGKGFGENTATTGKF